MSYGIRLDDSLSKGCERTVCICLMRFEFHNYFSAVLFVTALILFVYRRKKLCRRYTISEVYVNVFSNGFI